MDDNILFHFDTTLEREDYKTLLMLTTLRTPAKAVFSFLITAATCTVLIAFLLRISNMVTILFLFLFMLLLSIFFLQMKLEHQVRKLFSDTTPTSFQKQQSITFYRTFLTATNRRDNGITTVSYDTFYELLETANYLVCYFEKELVTLIRKKDIPDRQCEELCRFLRQMLGNRYKSL